MVGLNVVAPGGNPGEGYIIIPLNTYETVVAGTWAYGNASTQWLSYYLINSSHATLNEINFKCFMAAGTYTLTLMSGRGADQPIVKIYIDGTLAGTFDTYGVSTGLIEYTQTGISISSSSMKTLRFVVDGKNGSSSDYYVRASSIILRRTA